jgi:hypothetical protein
MRQYIAFSGVVGFVTATTLYLGGALGVFLMSLGLGLAMVYGPDWSQL